MATLIKADGTEKEVTPKSGNTFSLDELQTFVDGYIEMCTSTDNRWMVVNEEGKLKGLPVNEKATQLYGRDTLVGDILVCDKSQLD